MNQRNLAVLDPPAQSKGVRYSNREHLQHGCQAKDTEPLPWCPAVNGPQDPLNPRCLARPGLRGNDGHIARTANVTEKVCFLFISGEHDVRLEEVVIEEVEQRTQAHR